MKIEKVEAWDIIGKDRTVSVVGREFLEGAVFQQCLVESLVSRGIGLDMASYICSNISHIVEADKEARLITDRCIAFEMESASKDKDTKCLSYHDRCINWFRSHCRLRSSMLITIARAVYSETWADEWGDKMDAFIGQSFYINETMIIGNRGFIINDAGDFAYPFECFRIKD
jgi:hypothetical protein